MQTIDKNQYCKIWREPSGKRPALVVTSSPRSGHKRDEEWNPPAFFAQRVTSKLLGGGDFSFVNISVNGIGSGVRP